MWPIHRVPVLLALSVVLPGCALVWGIEDLPGGSGGSSTGGEAASGSTTSSSQSSGTGGAGGIGGAGGNGGAGGSCEAPMLPCAGGCVDITTEDDHCGACGHDCGDGATCSNGLCGPIEVTVHSGTGLRPNSLNDGGNFIFWALPNRIERLSKSGGSVLTTVFPASPRAFVIAEGPSAGQTDVIYTEAVGPRRIAIDGSNPRNVGGAYVNTVEIVTDGTAVYFATHPTFDPDTSSIERQADAVTGPLQITARTRSVKGMFAEPGLLFWVEAQTSANGDGLLMRWTAPNQIMQLGSFPSGAPRPSAVTANSNFIYILTEEGTLRRTPRANPGAIETVHSNFTGAGEVKTADGERIYWSDGSGAVYRLENDADILKLVATDGHVFAVDTDNVYFGTEDKIFRVAR